MDPRRTIVAAPPRSLSGRAQDDLRFIRSTMERAASCTCIPGWGGALMGLVALVASAIATRATSPRAWLAVWLSAAFVAAAIGLSDMIHKSRRERTSLRRGPAARFAATLAPGLVAGAVLTIALHRLGRHELLPGAWMLLYGASIASASAFTIPAVRWMGAAFLACGTLAFATGEALGDGWMAASFGGLHVVFGVWVALRGAKEPRLDG